ncbi:MAG: 3-hydroxybutyryl-CoA dehydrogenase [Ignavibacteriales bacterium]|nr:3-hydroxybutyryl-CoA dehydrogenase [Ignavibacteriales bacterium]
MDIKKAAIIGGGTMGNGIAAVFALHGFDTYLIETSDALLQRAVKSIQSSYDRMVKKAVIGQNDLETALSNLHGAIGISSVPQDCDIVIEAVFENLAVKKSIFNELHTNVKAECIFASNTSSISITELGADTRPDRFIGMHFMNPVPVMKLVEIIRGYSTSDETYTTIHNLSISLEKVPVAVNDYPGFIANRILMPMINEAIFALMEGVGDKEAIDTVMKLGMNHPMGPLALADFIGLDVCLAIMNVLYEGFKDSKYRPCPLLVKMVAAKKLGRKTGEGFFKY